jgi:hypothetical protein
MKLFKPTISFLILAGGLVSYSLMNSNLDGKTLRVAFPSTRLINTYEPTNIHMAYEYVLLENLYSPLVEIDPKGGLVLPAITESFQWKGNELHFQIRPQLKTSGGTPITAADVVFSLKRVILLSQNTHGNFKDLICPDQVLKSIDDPCDGIAQNSDVVILRPKKQKTVLLSMLAAIDFAIIPKTSVDPKTLAIVNFAETSGLYYLSRQSEDGSMTLKQNPNHFRNDSGVATTVELVAFNPKITTAISLFESNKVDHVPTTNSSKSEDIINYAKTHSDVQLHATMKIKNFVLVFTDRGKAELSQEQRIVVGKKVRAAFSKIYADLPGYQASEEFFPRLGDGGLSDQQRSEIQNLIENSSDKNIPAVKIGLLKSSGIEQWSNPIHEVMPNADLYLEKVIPDLTNYEKLTDMPHAIIAGTDTGFTEDINLISYSINAGFLGLKKNQRQKWVSDYMDIQTKEERIHTLRELHFKALLESAIVPLIISPFVALSRKPWKMELSELYANNQLWLIKQ